MKQRMKTETALIIAVAMLLVGFVGGVVFSGFRMGEAVHPPEGLQGPASVSTEADRTRIAEFEEAAKTSGDPSAWISLGNAYFDAEQPEKAISAYEKALGYQPENADVWTDLGVMYRKTGNPEKAIAAFDRAQTADPSHEASLYNKGIVQMHDLNDPAGAVETWTRLTILNPSATTPTGMRVQDLVEKLTPPASPQ